MECVLRPKTPALVRLTQSKHGLKGAVGKMCHDRGFSQLAFLGGFYNLVVCHVRCTDK